MGAKDSGDIEQIKRVGIGAAYKGAEALRHHFGNTQVKKKGRIDLVTEADTASEQTIIETIRAAFANHTILAEESGLNDGSPDHQWYIDPLDGTTNFAHGVGLVAVSIAYAEKGQLVLGIVLSPFTNELFIAVAGQGATLNGRPIGVSTEETVSDSLLVTGFPHDLTIDFNPMMARFSNCLSAARGVRRLGSAALDLCYVACGRFGGFWEQNLHPWDTAAGVLIAEEAGGTITDFVNREYSVDKKEILATNGKIHQEMIGILSLKDTR